MAKVHRNGVPKRSVILLHKWFGCLICPQEWRCLTHALKVLKNTALELYIKLVELYLELVKLYLKLVELYLRLVELYLKFVELPLKPVELYIKPRNYK